DAGLVDPPLPPDGATVRGTPGPAPANGAWGRAGCTLLALDAVDEAFARMALLEAWQAAVAAARPGGKGSRGGSGRTAKRRQR
ncbi:MAG: hypothetical protein ACK5BN_03090, partial [Planctomycetota bacterium]